MTTWIAFGMFPMANMNPDSRNDGRKVGTIASWLARSCDFATMLITMPIDSGPARKIAAIPNRSATLPPQRHLEEELPHPHGEEHVEHPDGEIRQELAQYQFPAH